MSGNQIAMVVGAGLMLAGFGSIGQPLLLLGAAVWLLFAFLAFLRQF